MWLTYCYSRMKRLEDALESGIRAVELEPENPMSHYFLGGTYWMLSVLEGDDEARRRALRPLRRAHELAPRYQGPLQLLADLHRQRGCYEDALSALREAVEIESSGEHELGRFVGAHALLGLVQRRRGELVAAAEAYERALPLLADEDHVYADAFTASVHCGLAELSFRERQYAEALPHLRHARDLAESSPRSLGIGWHLVRIHHGFARAFHRLNMLRDRDCSLERADELHAATEDYDFSAIWEGGDAEIHYERADTLAVMGRDDEAIASLERAVRHGWREHPRLRRDPGLSTLLQHPGVQRLVDEVTARLQTGEGAEPDGE